MSHWFDDLARLLAGGDQPRRRLLKAGSLLGLLLPALDAVLAPARAVAQEEEEEEEEGLCHGKCAEPIIRRGANPNNLQPTDFRCPDEGCRAARAKGTRIPCLCILHVNLNAAGRVITQGDGRPFCRCIPVTSSTARVCVGRCGKPIALQPSTRDR